jgi:hypothetical protein
MSAYPKHFLGEYLHRIIVLEEPNDPVEVKAQAVQLYDDGVMIQWMFPGASPDWAYEIDADEHRPELELRDDLGTQYNDAHSGSSGGDASFRGETAFVPAIPKATTSLEILGLPYPLSVDLNADTASAPLSR